MRIQIQCHFVPLSDMQRDFGIVVPTRLLLRPLQQARADALAAPIAQHRQRIDILFILLCLPFKPASNRGIELRLISAPNARSTRCRVLLTEEKRPVYAYTLSTTGPPLPQRQLAGLV